MGLTEGNGSGLYIQQATNGIVRTYQPPAPVTAHPVLSENYTLAP